MNIIPRGDKLGEAYAAYALVHGLPLFIGQHKNRRAFFQVGCYLKESPFLNVSIGETVIC